MARHQPGTSWTFIWSVNSTKRQSSDIRNIFESLPFFLDKISAINNASQRPATARDLSSAINFCDKLLLSSRVLFSIHPSTVIGSDQTGSSPLHPSDSFRIPSRMSGTTIATPQSTGSAAEPKKLSGINLYSRFAFAGAVCCPVTHGGLTPVDV